MGLLRVTPAQLRMAAIVGVLLLFGGNGFVAVAEQTLPSGLAALLVSTTPLWLVVFGFLTGERARRASVAGILVASAYQMLIGGVALTLGGLVHGEAARLDPASVPAAGRWALAYLVVAVPLGWALLGEHVTLPVVVGGALAVAGVVLVISSER